MTSSRQPAPATVPRAESRRSVQPPAWTVWAAPLMAVAIVHGGALGGFFASDDLAFLARSRGLASTPWGWARPLPGVWRWTLLTAWFGPTPLPHLLLALVLHAASALLVARVVLLAGLDRRAAIAAGVLVGGSAVAYTSTHWASGLGEVMAAAFALGALALHLECRLRARPALAWLAGACAVGAVLSKESSLLLPVAVWAFDRLVPVRGEGRGALREIAWLGGLAAAFVVAGWAIAPHVGGEPYALGGSPIAWLANLSTYAAWLVRLLDPIPDRNAVPDPGLLPWGLLVTAAAAWAAWSERAASVRPVTAGLAWFLLLLAPVLPLEKHTYLYYLVVPNAGIGLAAGALLSRFLARARTSQVNGLFALALAAYVANAAWQAHVRGTLTGGQIVVDRVARESAMLRHVLAGLRAARVAAGDTIVLVNPYPLRSVDAARNEVRSPAEGFGEHAYIPLVAALRSGAALRLFRPGVTVLGMGDRVPREWERARVFRFESDGRLEDLGRGPAALDSLASDYLASGRWPDAKAALERVVELGGDGPEVRWRLGYCLSRLGDDSGAIAQAKLVLERWPDSPRAALLRENAARAARAGMKLLP